MDYITITIIFVVILYLFSIDWKSFGDYMKKGGWFFILVYILIGISIYKFFTQGTGH